MIRTNEVLCLMKMRWSRSFRREDQISGRCRPEGEMRKRKRSAREFFCRDVLAFSFPYPAFSFSIQYSTDHHNFKSTWSSFNTSRTYDNLPIMISTIETHLRGQSIRLTLKTNKTDMTHFDWLLHLDLRGQRHFLSLGGRQLDHSTDIT